MFPIRDTIPSRTTPVVTWALIGINILVFAYEFSLPRQALESFIYSFGMVPAGLFGDAPDSLAAPAGGAGTFLTSMFIHGGLLHLIANMWTLWIFGDNVEDRMGKVRFSLFYLTCGGIAALVHLATNLTSTVPTVGASGAIAGVLGAYFLLYPRARVLTLVPIFFYPLFIEIPAFFYLGFWFLTQLLSGGLAETGGQAGGIAWWAHVGGFVAGLILVRFFIRRQTAPGPKRNAAIPRQP